MGRKLRRNVPITQEQLKSQLPTRETLFKREVVNKNNQKIHFDSHYRTKDLPEVSVCDKVWISNLKQKGFVEENLEVLRSYIIRSPRGVFRRNRKFLHHLLETTPLDTENKSTDEGQQDSSSLPQPNPENLSTENPIRKILEILNTRNSKTSQISLRERCS